MPADHCQRSFQSQGGTSGAAGLGLTIAKAFTEAVNGDLTVEDTLGGGATFVFSLQRGCLPGGGGLSPPGPGQEMRSAR